MGSSVTIRVGTPPQWVYIFPNTLSSETWVIGPAGCDGSMSSYISWSRLFHIVEGPLLRVNHLADKIGSLHL